MGRYGQGAGDRGNGVDGGGVDGPEVGPAAGDFHGVDHEPLADEGLERGHVVAVLHPVVHQRIVEALGTPGAGLGLHHVDHRRDHDRVALVERQQHAGSLRRPVVPVGLDRVVEAQHRRCRPPLADAPHRLECGVERAECPGGGSLCRGRGVHAQPGRGDDAQRSLRPDEELGQVGPHGLAGDAAGGDAAAVGQHHVEALDDVLDLAVPPRQLSRAAAGDPPTDGGQGHRLGPVPDRRGVVPTQFVLEVVTEGPRRDVHDHRRGIDRPDAGHAAHVEHDATVDRHGVAQHTRAPAGRGQRDAGLVAHRRDRRHLGLGGGPAHHRTQATDLVVERPDHPQGPPVTTGLGPCHRIGGHLGARSTQLLDHRVGHGDLGGPQAVDHLGGITAEGDRGCGISWFHQPVLWFMASSRVTGGRSAEVRSCSHERRYASAEASACSAVQPSSGAISSAVAAAAAAESSRP